MRLHRKGKWLVLPSSGSSYGKIGLRGHQVVPALPVYSM